jgi:hypothetical protein
MRDRGHQLYRKLDELMGPQEATTLMELLPPSGWGDVARKQDLVLLRQDVEGFRREWKQDLQAFQVANGAEYEALRHELRAEMERLARRQVVWTSSMVLAGVGLAFAAGRLAF